jgi:hypothetical protein
MASLHDSGLVAGDGMEKLLRFGKLDQTKPFSPFSLRIAHPASVLRAS